MGYGRFGRLWHVELPLALPGILTGVRLATVSTVALVTVGGFIGQGGLGDLIMIGFRNNFYRAEIVTGTILCVALRPGPRPGPDRPRPAADAVEPQEGHMSYFQRRARLAQRPAQLDQPGRPAGPAAGAPGDHLLGGAAGLRGRPAARRLARAPRPGRRGVITVANLTRALPTLAVLTILPLTPIGFGKPPVSSRWPSSRCRRCWRTRTPGCARSTRRPGTRPSGMGLSGGQLLRRVELPLAVPYLAAGLRTAAVQVVATADARHLRQRRRPRADHQRPASGSASTWAATRSSPAASLWCSSHCWSRGSSRRLERLVTPRPLRSARRRRPIPAAAAG